MELPRVITDHHDGYDLAASILIEADGPGPGGASHNYRVSVPNPRAGEISPSGDLEAEAGELTVATIQYQTGPRGEPGSTPGVLDSVLLAIVVDRMRSFQAGPYSCRENAIVLTKLQEALHWLRHRADERAKRGGYSLT
jgi:hypothetical protein